MKKKNNKGFSLIELIIAIAILVILTGLLAPQFMKYIEKSREAKDMQTLDTVYSAVQGAIADEEAYKNLKDNMATGGNYAGIDAAAGLELTTITAKSKLSGTDAEKKAVVFANELVTLLGTTDANNLKLVSKKANVADNGNASKIFVKVDDKMQVTVFAKDKDGNVIDDLIVGKK